MLYDFFNRLGLRVQITLAGSVIAHLLILNLLSTKTFNAPAQKMTLREIEYLEETPPPTEMEKLMHKLSAPPPPARSAPTEATEEIIAELEKTSFKQVVGIRKTPMTPDEITDADLTRLARLPKPDAVLPAPALLHPQAKKISLAPSALSPAASLESKVVPLAELPPADFGPVIARKEFQQPELIIKNVKAERRQQSAPPGGGGKTLRLQRDTLISGEVQGREILRREAPPVPRWLEEKGIEAEVVISFVVNPDGEVGDKIYIEKTSGYTELDQLAIAALKNFLFAPLPLNIKQVEQKGSIVIRFTVGR